VNVNRSELLSVMIHPTAIVDPKAQLGRNVEIGALAVVGPEVVLGDGCKLHPHAIVEGCTTLGKGCQVFPQAVLGMQPQDLKYHGEKTRLTIGDHNIFREMVTAHPGTDNGGGETRIGDNNLFLVGVHIAHDCTIGSRCVFANYAQIAGHVHIEDHVNMGGHSGVHHFVTVGRHAFVGGMTRVPADVPPYVVIVAARGTRSEIRMINGIGLQRSGYSHEDIAALKDAFMKLFSRRVRSNGSAIRDRVQTLLATAGLNQYVEYLCRFLLRSFAHGRHGRYLEALRRDAVHRDSWTLKREFELTVHVLGRGSVERMPRRGDGDRHEVVELTAKADPGWRFDGWNGSLLANDNPLLVTLDRDKTVDATFLQD